MFARFIAKNLNRLYIIQCALFLAVLTVFFSLASPFFLDFDNFNNILTASAVIGLLALGTTFVIASGGIDLSSAAVMALSSTVCAYCLQKVHMPCSLAIIVTIATGTACGMLTGFFINLTKAPSFIVSLGMLSVARALAYILSGGMPLYGLPNDALSIIQGTWLGLPVCVAILLLGVAVAYVLLKQTRFGRHAVLIGDNEFASKAMGIPVSTMRLKIFSLAGTFSGLAGLVFTLRTNSGDPSAGQNYELVAITAVILGGTDLFGGRATILGTLLGVLCLGVLQNGLNLLAVSTYYQILFVGFVLLAAAFLSRVGHRS